MASAGTAYMTVLPDTKSFAGQLDGLLGPITSKFEGKFGKFGKAATVGFGAVVVGAGLAGKALYDIGASFDSAYDQIRTGTGATGKELEGLKDDFRDVVKNVPTDFDTAAKAITEINQRLDVTGQPLRQLSKQFLELSRITGTDVETNVESVTRAFRDWEVKTGQQSGQLDKFFRAAQLSGTSVDDLASSVVQFGAPLRKVGFSLDEATAMFAAFEKAGVNTQTMMPGLRIALGNFLEEGRDPGKALIQTFQGIEDGTISTSKALEIFGTRAGADMIEAIEQGRFSLDDMTKAIKTGDDTILKAGEDTQDFGERWQMLKNRIFVALEPAATAVFNAIGDGMLQLSNLMAGKGNISEHFRTAIADIRSAITPLVPIFQWAVNATKMVFGGLTQYFKGAFQIIGGIVKVFSALFRGDWSAMWDGIKQIGQGALNLVVGMFRVMTAPLRAAAQALAGAVSGPFDVVKNLASSVGNWLGNVATKIASFVTGFSNKAHDLGSAIFRGVLSVVKDIPGAVANWIGAIPGRIANFIASAAAKAFDLGKSIFNGIKDGMSSLMQKVVDTIKAPINALIDALNAFQFTIHFPEIDPPGPGPVIPGKDIHIDPIPGNIGHLAAGTDYWAGGWAEVSERGGELAYLPRGAAVADARRTRELLSGSPRRGSLRGLNGDGAANEVYFEVHTHGSGMPDPGLFFVQVDTRLRALGVG